MEIGTTNVCTDFNRKDRGYETLLSSVIVHIRILALCNVSEKVKGTVSKHNDTHFFTHLAAHAKYIVHALINLYNFKFDDNDSVVFTLVANDFRAHSWPI